MDNERQQSHRGRWIWLYVMLGFVGLSIFSLADAIKNPAPVFQTTLTLNGVDSNRAGVWLTDGSGWVYELNEDGEFETRMRFPPAR